MLNSHRPARSATCWLGCVVLTSALAGREAAAQDGPAGARTTSSTTPGTIGADVGSDSAFAVPFDRAAPRVRTLGSVAGRLLEQAVLKSPSVAAMLNEIQRSDLLVYVETRNLPKLLHGFVQIAGSTASVRYVRLVLAVPNTDRDLLATLGHELRHALEIAGMPDVRDEASLSRRYTTMGVPRGKSGYETAAAREAGRQVAREVALAGR